mmetsp:Transcript_2673/g.6081  ORF Transcript_2673/g.6081 Transcript_2673/m.6081 type:complete len:416 (-) Transcript_2673:155-1402(-)
MPIPPQLLAIIQELKDSGADIDENDPQQVMAVLRMLQSQQQEARRDQQEVAAPPPQRIPDKVLSSLDVSGVASHIREGKAKKIIVMVGAGLSTAAGIPDFRTPGTGLYDNLKKYDLPRPEAIFSIDYFQERPGAFYELAKEMWPGNFAPTKAHYFIRLLEEKGLLLRCFSQNIDSLEELAGVSGDRVVAAHGNFSSARGVQTKQVVPIEEVKAAVMQGEEGWKEMTERRGELVKPDIVFFGEGLPKRFHQLCETDFEQSDLLIVMGTSLVVAPFCNCITFVDDNCPRLLINREPAGLEMRGATKFQQGMMRGGFRVCSPETNYRDAWFEGDCDAGVEALCAELGWSADLERTTRDGLKAFRKLHGGGEPEVEDTAGVAATAAPQAKPGSGCLGSIRGCFAGLFASRGQRSTDRSA